MVKRAVIRYGASEPNFSRQPLNYSGLMRELYVGSPWKAFEVMRFCWTEVGLRDNNGQGIFFGLPGLWKPVWLGYISTRSEAKSLPTKERIGESFDFDEILSSDCDKNSHFTSSFESEELIDASSESWVPQTPTGVSLDMEASMVACSKLPSPSCIISDSSREWNADLFPFDKETSINACKSIGRVLSLEGTDSEGEADKMISQAAKEMHKMKVRNTRSKLEMENHRLGPAEPSPTGPRKCRKGKGRYSIDC
ncbi:unnamed protein product [Linum trigynum]|uniref:Uncharacterized protein n=1 Tax=Linum trigynum TaxID=586398 RepID=A0AAV2CLK9_9ROSI